MPTSSKSALFYFWLRCNIKSFCNFKNEYFKLFSILEIPVLQNKKAFDAIKESPWCSVTRKFDPKCVFSPTFLFIWASLLNLDYISGNFIFTRGKSIFAGNSCCCCSSPVCGNMCSKMLSNLSQWGKCHAAFDVVVHQ